MYNNFMQQIGEDISRKAKDASILLSKALADGRIDYQLFKEIGGEIAEIKGMGEGLIWCAKKGA